MPPVTTIPSEETDIDSQPPAFQILNNDNLDSSVGIVKGEAIFKPFGKDQKLKPNIMVYPTRRTNGNLEDAKNKNFTKSNGYIPTYNKTNNVTLGRKYSNSHGNLSNNTNSADIKRKESEEIQKQIPDGLDLDFTKTLETKLRKLQKEEKLKRETRIKLKTLFELPRKPFVTTVKKGEFLEPPPEYASLLGLSPSKMDEKMEDKLYAYASRPRIIPNNRVSTAGSNSEVHRSKCEAAAIAAAVIASGVAGLKDAANRPKRDINSNNIRKSV